MWKQIITTLNPAKTLMNTQSPLLFAIENINDINVSINMFCIYLINKESLLIMWKQPNVT